MWSHTWGRQGRRPLQLTLRVVWTVLSSSHLFSACMVHKQVARSRGFTTREFPSFI